MSRFRPPLSDPPVLAPRTGAAPPAPAAPLSVKAIPARPPGPAPPVRSIGGIGFILTMLGAYTLMFTVPIAELSTIYLQFYIPLVPVTGAILALALVFQGQLGRFWNTPVAKPWMALLAVFLAAAVLGTYPRMSTLFMLEYGARFHILPFFCCAFALSTRQVRYCIYWLAGGALLVLVLCATLGQYAEGRLFIPHTSLGNPNDLAFGLLLGTTCLLLFLYTRSVFLRVLWIVAFPLSIFFILRTGSRANFVTVIALVPVLFTMVSARAKVAISALIPVAAVIVVLVIPGSTLKRLTLILINPTEALASNSEFGGAIGSQIARTELQKRAIELTLHRPVLGVGARMFQEGVETMVRAETGQKSGWQEAHNTYLEISAENGIPALILYVWVLVLCLRMNYASYKTCKRNFAQNAALGQSVCLVLLTVAFCVGIAFCNAAYAPQTDVVVALSTANFLAVRNESKAFAIQPSLAQKA